MLKFLTLKLYFFYYFHHNFQGEIKYDPGDHVGIMACNRKELVDSLLSRMKDIDNHDEPVQLQLMKETHTSAGMSILTHNVALAVFRDALFIKNCYFWM